MRLLKGSAWALTLVLLLGLVCTEPTRATISNDTGETVFVQLCEKPLFEGACDGGRKRTALAPESERIVSIPQVRLSDWWQVLNRGHRVIGCLRLQNDPEAPARTFSVSEVEACPD